MGGVFSTNGEKRYEYRLLMGKRPLGRQRRRWVDNIRMDLGEVGWGDVDWIGLAQESSCKFGIEPSGYIQYWKLLSGLTTGGLSSGAQLRRVS
jgi:hypothetical protein